MTQTIELTNEMGVTLVDSMGTDESVVHAARVSVVGAKAETEHGERQGLLRFLMSNHHASPFEHITATFMVDVPVFVAREWHRHRTQCLAADTLITCVQPNGVVYQRSIEHLYRTNHGVEAPDRWMKNGYQQKDGRPARKLVPGTDRYRALNKNQKRVLRVFDEDSRVFTTGVMGDVWQSGVKELYSVQTKNGRLVRASAEHPFLTTAGWVKVKDMVGDELLIYPGRVRALEAGQQYPPSLRQGIGVWTTMQRAALIGEGDNCYICGELFPAQDLQLDHVVPVVESLLLALDVTNLRPACKPCHRRKTNGEQGKKKDLFKWGERHTQLVGKPQRVAEEMTYDLQMSGDHHNYLADHLVVHNSFNERSGRYSTLEPRFYAPDYDRPLKQVGKPGAYKFELGTDDEILVLYREMRFSFQTSWNAYEYLLDEGLAKEVARNVLPLSVYTSFYATANLRNWINFCSLRTSPDALYEIREAAFKVEEQLHKIAPTCMNLWDELGRSQL